MRHILTIKSELTWSRDVSLFCQRLAKNASVKCFSAFTKTQTSRRCKSSFGAAVWHTCAQKDCLRSLIVNRLTQRHYPSAAATRRRPLARPNVTWPCSSLPSIRGPSPNLPFLYCRLSHNYCPSLLSLHCPSFPPARVPPAARPTCPHGQVIGLPWGIRPGSILGHLVWVTPWIMSFQ